MQSMQCQIAEPPRAPADELDRRVAVLLRADALRCADVVPRLLALPARVPWLKTFGMQLPLILGELFNNALDHGVLKLDSTLRRRPEDMTRYLAQRTQAMQTLVDASVHVVFERVRGGAYAVRITVTDSGEGFDHAAVVAALPGSGTLPYGRGIALVRGLCRSLEYRGAGNVAIALYERPHPHPH